MNWNTCVIHFDDVWHVLPTIRLTTERLDFNREIVWAVEFVWLAKGFAIEWTV